MTETNYKFPILTLTGFALAVSLAVLPARTSAQTQVTALSASAASVSTETDGLQVQQGVATSSLEILVNGAIALQSELNFSELSIANPEIADISTLTDKSIYVLGKAPGRTTLMLFGTQGQVQSIVNITVAPDITEFKQRLALILPGEDISAFTANDGIVLAGQISSQTAMGQALELANRYAPGRISNLMVLDTVEEQGIDLAAIRTALRAALPEAAISARLDAGMVLLEGAVTDAGLLAVATEVASRHAPGQINNLISVEEPYVAPDAEMLAGKLLKILEGELISVDTVGESVILSGSVSSPEKMAQAVQLAQLFAPQSSISNLLSVEAVRTCTIRTRKGAEVVATTIPCQE